MKLVVIALVGSLTMAAARPASAGPLVIAPPGGTEVPATSLVYLMASAWRPAPVVEAHHDGDPGGAIRLRVEPVSRSLRDDVRVDRVRLRGRPGELVSIHAGWGDDSAWAVYRITRDAPIVHGAVVMGFETPHLGDDCPHPGTVIGVRGGVAAYRLEWDATSWRDLVSATHARYLVPAATADVGWREALDDDVVRLWLGDPRCGGNALPSPAFDQPREARLILQFSDGHDETVPLGWLRRAPAGLTRVTPIAVAPAAAPAGPPAAPTEPWWPFALFPLVTIVGCGVIGRRAALAAAAAIVLFAAARPAAAECGPAPIVLSPPRHAVLAVDPILFVFVPGWPGAGADPTALAWQDGRPVDAALDRVAITDAWSVYRISIHGTHPGLLAVRFGDETLAGETVATYQLVDRAAVRDRAELIATQAIEDVWSCSHTRAIAFTLRGDAVAYQLAWFDPATRAIATAYLPAVDQSSSAARGDTLDVLAGFLSCVGDVVPAGALAEPRAVELRAIFSDGRDASIPIGIAQIDDQHGKLLVPDDFRSPAVLAPDPQAPAPDARDARWDLVPPTDTPDPLWPALAAAGLGGAAAMGVAAALLVRLLRGRHRRRPARLGAL